MRHPLRASAASFACRLLFLLLRRRPSGPNHRSRPKPSGAPTITTAPKPSSRRWSKRNPKNAEYRVRYGQMFYERFNPRTRRSSTRKP